MNPEFVLPGLLAMGAIVAVAFGLARLTDARHLSKRFEAYVPRPGGLPPAAQTARRGILVGGVERELIRRGKNVDIAQELARADLLIKPAEYVVLVVISVIVAFGLGLLIFKVLFVAIPF